MIPDEFITAPTTTPTSSSSGLASPPMNLTATELGTDNDGLLAFLQDEAMNMDMPSLIDPFPMLSPFPGSKTAEFTFEDHLNDFLDRPDAMSEDLGLECLQALPQAQDPVNECAQEPEITQLVYIPVPQDISASFVLSHILRTRMAYAIPMLRHAPTTFVETTGTPWSHPSLYKDGLPPVIEEVHAACALYMARNPRNNAVIMRSIEGRLARLLNAPLKSSSSSSSSSPILDALYRTQALLLYQIMRMLNDDFASCADNLAGTTALEEATNTLKDYLIIHSGSSDDSFEYLASRLTDQSLADFEEEVAMQPRHQHQHHHHHTSNIQRHTEPLPLYPLGPTRAFWERWAVEESVRRTFLAAFLFCQISNLVAGNPVARCLGRTAEWNCWTLGAHLWQAPDPVDFAHVWNARHRGGGDGDAHEAMIVSPGKMQRVLQDAKADDMDEFARLIFTVTLGVDEAKAWFASKGGKL